MNIFESKLRVTDVTVEKIFMIRKKADNINRTTVIKVKNVKKKWEIIGNKNVERRPRAQ